MPCYALLPYSCVDAVVPARGQGLVDTGLSIKLPPSTYGRVAPRSGLAVKNGISTGAGVIDEDYRGPVKVVLFNHSDTDFKSKSPRRCSARSPAPSASLPTLQL